MPLLKFDVCFKVFCLRKDFFVGRQLTSIANKEQIKNHF